MYSSCNSDLYVSLYVIHLPMNKVIIDPSNINQSSMLIVQSFTAVIVYKNSVAS